MPHATPHRILFIDAYDSFTNNIIALLETHFHVSVTTIKIDEPISDFAEFLQPFSAVVAGPGPGDPRNAKDVGWIQQLWSLDGQDLVPVLGICLGFQSLVLAFGGAIDRLGEPRHGVVRRVRGTGESIFYGVDEVETVQYHSLFASIESEVNHGRTRSDDLENISLKSSDLRPLAWDYEVDNKGDRQEGTPSDNSWRILMAVKHKSKPFFGLQFHAESICSNGNARKVIQGWWEFVKKWRKPSSCQTEVCSVDLGTVGPMKQGAHPPSMYRRLLGGTKISSNSINGARNTEGQKLALNESLGQHNGISCSQPYSCRSIIQIVAKVVDNKIATVPCICKTLGLTNGEVIVLDSELHQRADVGEYSIIGIVSPDSLRLEYQIGTNHVSQIHNGRTKTIDLRRGETIFSYLKSFMGQYKLKGSGAEVPFWGGLMGFISYEACLETIGIIRSKHRTRKSPQRPDLSFVFVERSIVIDHYQQKIHVQTIRPQDQEWVEKTALQIGSIDAAGLEYSKSIPPSNTQVSLPNPEPYKSKVRACQSIIRAGESYEICLTTQARIHSRKRSSAWPLYLRLRRLNAAPFSAYIRLGKLTLLSSSPERFLKWSRPTKSTNFSNDESFDREEKTITCQFRPIKGTVQRQPDPHLPPLTLAEATSLLATPKERAENLMIVDLIRHDLHGVVGSGRVNVPKLMVVEEYATLFQLVSVIEGNLVVDEDKPDESMMCKHPTQDSHRSTDLDPSKRTRHHPPSPKSGIDILAASLPPGSMTGAPKLRSCQHLCTLEDGPRGIYSGVLGYLNIGGGGDFSVIIRSVVRWEDDDRVDIDMSNGAKEEKNDADHDDDDQCEHIKATEPEAKETSSPMAQNVANDDDDDDESKDIEYEKWTIGAGGAVTSLSTDRGEWEEMCAKMKSTLRLFGPSVSVGLD